MWLATISLFVIFPQSLDAHHNNNRQDHAAPSFSTNINVAFNFYGHIDVYGPVNINAYGNWELTAEHMRYRSEQRDVVLWVGCICCVSVTLCIVFIIQFGPGYLWRQAPTQRSRSEDRLTCHPVGTLTVVSDDGSSILHDPNGTETILPNTPVVTDVNRMEGGIKLWDVKEPYPISYGRQLRVTSFTIENRGQNNSIDQELGSDQRPSLATSLYGNTRLHRTSRIAWFILVVAFDDDLPDPEHDLRFWKKMLDEPTLKSEAIHFRALPGQKATPENIENALAQLFHDSESLGMPGHTRLFVYFTGEGDGQNRMCLPNNKFLCEEDINWWLRDLRATWGYSQPITLLLDVCRTNKDMPRIQMHQGANLIFSSSLNQKAHALRFKPDRDMPYSCFMLAYIIASHASLNCTKPEFLANVEHRLRQLTTLTSLIASKIGGGDPGSQQPDWSQAVVSTQPT
ncbi:unnamed protein product [Rhizoctonia solani]|uniref:Uncharacterized protein n=1 Tax=Rhizoctonia solani TaxID=456999 RepID=A0A8H2WWL4_9AGAM|nr:unnamed protein product [Rhizoctonia solani]